MPQDRVRIIKDEKTRFKLKKSLNVGISFQENSVLINGEGIDLYQAKNIVKAIGRGFSPNNAFRLLNEDEMLETIDLNEFSKNKLRIVKARLIGTNGKTWKTIEKFSGCSLSIYGKTVSLIGNYEQLKIAKEAVEMIIRGCKHSKVYNFLYQAKL